MLLTMGCLYNWADWNTGVVKHVSAGGLHTWTLKAYSERTFSEALRKLEWMGWITRHMMPGSHKSYAVTIHNYKTTDDAGKVHVINPKGITTYEKFPSGRRDEASRETSDEGSDEGSDEASDEASDETSDRTSLNTNLKNQSKDKSQDESQNKGLASKLVSSDESLRSSSTISAVAEDGVEVKSTQNQNGSKLAGEPEEKQNPFMVMKTLKCTDVIHDEFEAWNLEHEIGSLKKIDSCMVYWQMGTEELRSLIRWSATHKFWKNRIVHVKSLANNMERGLATKESGGSAEKSLVSQFRRAMKAKAKAALDRKSHTKEFFDNLDLREPPEEGVPADSRALAEQEGWIKVAECDWCHATKDTGPYDDSGRRICKACAMTPGVVDDELEAGKAAAAPCGFDIEEA